MIRLDRQLFFWKIFIRYTPLSELHLSDEGLITETQDSHKRNWIELVSDWWCFQFSEGTTEKKIMIGCYGEHVSWHPCEEKEEFHFLDIPLPGMSITFPIGFLNEDDFIFKSFE